jgi:hypothetical protein
VKLGTLTTHKNNLNIAQRKQLSAPIVKTCKKAKSRASNNEDTALDADPGVVSWMIRLRGRFRPDTSHSSGTRDARRGIRCSFRSAPDDSATGHRARDADHGGCASVFFSAVDPQKCSSNLR